MQITPSVIEVSPVRWYREICFWRNLYHHSSVGCNQSRVFVENTEVQKMEVFVEDIGCTT